MNTVAVTLQLQFVDGVWLGWVETSFGSMEMVLDGTPDEPNGDQVAALQAFLPVADAAADRLRRKFLFGFLQQPTRFAVNNQNRVGVEFRNRITGSKKVLFATQ